MKVLYLLDIFPSVSQTFVLNEILEIQKKGILVEVFAFFKPKEGRVQPEVERVQRVYYAGRRRPGTIVYGHWYWLLKAPRRYGRALRYALSFRSGIQWIFLTRLDDVFFIHRRAPDHIHAHFGGRASDLAMLVHLLTGIPFSFTTHRYEIFDAPPRNYPLKSRLAKKHITISDYNKHYLVRRFGIREDKLAVIHCGVSFGRPLPESGGKGDGTILSVGRLRRQKGFDILIRACAERKREGVPFQCLVIGEGPERRPLEELVQTLGLERHVRLLGAKTSGEVWEWLSKASLMALPSRSEGIPVSLMEAMALKVPVIGPRIHGVGELVEDGRSGFLVPPEDVDLLADRIKILLKDEAVRKSFVENGYQKVLLEFNNQSETDKLLAVWRS